MFHVFHSFRIVLHFPMSETIPRTLLCIRTNCEKIIFWIVPRLPLISIATSLFPMRKTVPKTVLSTWIVCNKAIIWNVPRLPLISKQNLSPPRDRSQESPRHSNRLQYSRHLKSSTSSSNPNSHLWFFNAYNRPQNSRLYLNHLQESHHLNFSTSSCNLNSKQFVFLMRLTVPRSLFCTRNLYNKAITWIVQRLPLISIPTSNFPMRLTDFRTLPSTRIIFHKYVIFSSNFSLFPSPYRNSFGNANIFNYVFAIFQYSCWLSKLVVKAYLLREDIFREKV